MKQSRIDQILAGQTNIARKVFEAVPIAEEWSGHQIRAELLRIGATNNDFRIIEGCLRSLKDCGVVIEPRRGFFRRKAERPPTPIIAYTQPINQPKAPATMPTPNPSAQFKSTAASPLDLLAALSHRMGTIAADVAELKKDLEDAAIVVEQHFTESEKRFAQLEQLRTLLKGVVQ